MANPTIPISSLLNVDNSSTMEDPVVAVERGVQHSLDQLESTGVLQACNRMDIESLLNPVEESRTGDNPTNEEICQAVLDGQKAWEEGLVNDGDDNVDDDASIEAPPTPHKVHLAASVINWYVNNINDPLAHKLEGVLASFSQQMCLEETRSMVDSRITDFFPNN